MSDIAELTLRINSLEAKQAKKDMDEMEVSGAKLAKSADVLQEGFKRLAITLGPAVLAGSFAVAMRAAIDLQDHYVRLSEIAGTTASVISSMELPARLSGTSLDTVAMSVARLSKALGEARLGDVQKGKLFSALGINPADGRDAADVLVDVSKALTNMKDQTIADSASVQLLSRGFAEMKPFMKEVTEQGSLHARVTDEQARAAKEFNDTITKINFNLENNRIKLANQLVPTLQLVAEEFEHASKQGSAFSDVVGGGMLTILQTMAVVGSDVAFVLKMIGGEIGVIAAQTAILLRANPANLAIMMAEDVVNGTNNAKQAIIDLGKVGFISDEWKRDSAQARKDLDDFQARIMGLKGSAQGGVRPDGADEGAIAGIIAEAKLRKMAEDARLYDSRVAASKGFYEISAETIKLGVALEVENEKQGLISKEELLARQGTMENAKLQLLRRSMEEQQALAGGKGDLGKAKEMEQGIAQVNAQIVANEVLTQARITSLRDATDTAWKQNLARKIADLQEANFTEMEILENQRIQRENLVNAAAAQGFIDDDQWQAMTAMNTSKYEADKTKLIDEETKKRLGINKVHRELDLASAGTFFGYMSGMMNSKSREMFEIGKVAAIAGAVIDTYKAATGAYASLSAIPIVGPALGAAAAAAAVVAGLANVQAIKAQQFGGGGGGATPTFAASPATGLPSGTPGGDVGTAPAGRGQNTTVHFLGGKERFTREDIRDLFDAINEHGRDGGQLVIAD